MPNLATLALLALQTPDLPYLPAGESIRATLPPPASDAAGSELRVALDPGDARRVTIELSSYDVDMLLRVENGTGEVVAEDDDSGVETDARLVLSAGASSNFVLIAVSKRGAGEVVLSVHSGELAAPSGAALLEARMEWNRDSAARALDRGDRHSAAIEYLEADNRAPELRRFEEARAAFEQTLALARELGELGMEAAAFGNITKTWLDAGDRSSQGTSPKGGAFG